MKTTRRSYKTLISLGSFEERYEYLRLPAAIGDKTFGYDRWLNQRFYSSVQWKAVRREVLIRDQGYDLGFEGRLVGLYPVVHHINPVLLRNLDSNRFDPEILDPDNLITTSNSTHRAIHYGNLKSLPSGPVIRKPGDTKLW